MGGICARCTADQNIFSRLSGHTTAYKWICLLVKNDHLESWVRIKCMLKASERGVVIRQICSYRVTVHISRFGLDCMNLSSTWYIIASLLPVPSEPPRPSTSLFPQILLLHPPPCSLRSSSSILLPVCVDPSLPSSSLFPQILLLHPPSCSLRSFSSILFLQILLHSHNTADACFTVKGSSLYHFSYSVSLCRAVHWSTWSRRIFFQWRSRFSLPHWWLWDLEWVIQAWSTFWSGIVKTHFNVVFVPQSLDPGCILSAGREPQGRLLLPKPLLQIKSM